MTARGLRWSGALVAVALSGCTLDVPPSVPGATAGGTMVVPDPRSDGDLAGGEAEIDDCAVVCPRREAREIAACHATRLDRRLARHRAHLGESSGAWVVCYYEVD